jgi:hypothetical protein
MAVDDAVRLLIIDARVPTRLRAATLRNRELARLGSGLDGSAADLQRLLPEEAATLAVAVGAVLSHHALAFLRRAASGIDWLTLDAALLSARRPERARLEAEAYASFLEAVDIRCQIEWHTLDPEEGDIHRWLRHIIEWRRDWRTYKTELAHRLAIGVRSPLFDPRDPVFELSERLRRNQVVRGGSLGTARAISPYGQSLLAALDGLANAVAPSV